MKRRQFLHTTSALTLSASLAGRAVAAEPIDIDQFREAAVTRWEKAIAALEEQDKTEQHPDDSVLFVGSSSIRLWANIATDLAPYHAIQRGYGGARWTDVAVFADRLITPHKFRGVVFFVGNDIAGRESDRTPQEVADLFSYVLGRVRAHNQTAEVFYIAVTPTESRWQAWPKIKAANSAARAVCRKQKHTHFIGTESIFLGADGKPIANLFRADRLHLNADGYLRWTAIVKSHLDSVFDGAG